MCTLASGSVAAAPASDSRARGNSLVEWKVPINWHFEEELVENAVFFPVFSELFTPAARASVSVSCLGEAPAARPPVRWDSAQLRHRATLWDCDQAQEWHQGATLTMLSTVIQINSFQACFALVVKWILWNLMNDSIFISLWNSFGLTFCVCISKNPKNMNNMKNDWKLKLKLYFHCLNRKADYHKCCLRSPN